MPLAGKLVVDQTHADNIADRKGSFGAVCIVIDSDQGVDVVFRVRKLMPVHDVLILMAVAHKNMREHHLGHPDGASPASIIAVPDLEVTTYIPGQ